MCNPLQFTIHFNYAKSLHAMFLNWLQETSTEYLSRMKTSTTTNSFKLKIDLKIASKGFIKSYFLVPGGVQDPGWNVLAVLMGSSLISVCPNCVAEAWPLTWVWTGWATRPSSYSLVCRALSLSPASTALILICSL